jgi:hypothetical protein
MISSLNGYASMHFPRHDEQGTKVAHVYGRSGEKRSWRKNVPASAKRGRTDLSEGAADVSYCS